MQPKQEVIRSTLPSGDGGKSYIKYGSKSFTWLWYMGNRVLGYGKATLVVCDQLFSGFCLHNLQDTYRLRFRFTYKSLQH